MEWCVTIKNFFVIRDINNNSIDPLIDLLQFVYLYYSMEGGELFQRIQDRQDSAFTERGIYKKEIKKFLSFFPFFCII